MEGVQVLIILVLTAGILNKTSVQSMSMRPCMSKCLLSITTQRRPPKRETNRSPGFSSLKTIELHFYKGDTIKRRISDSPFKREISNSPVGTLTGDKIWHQ